jgi:hypothetical protein
MPEKLKAFLDKKCDFLKTVTYVLRGPGLGGRPFWVDSGCQRRPLCLHHTGFAVTLENAEVIPTYWTFVAKKAQ